MTEDQPEISQLTGSQCAQRIANMRRALPHGVRDAIAFGEQWLARHGGVESDVIENVAVLAALSHAYAIRFSGKQGSRPSRDKRDIETSVLYLARAHAIEPGNMDVSNNYADLLIKQGKFNAALGVLSDALGLAMKEIDMQAQAKHAISAHKLESVCGLMRHLTQLSSHQAGQHDGRTATQWHAVFMEQIVASDLFTAGELARFAVLADSRHAASLVQKSYKPQSRRGG